jgi:hypothetical protein
VTKPTRRQIEVPIRQDETDAERRLEVLDVDELGPNRYRLAFSPGLVEGLASGDEFELCPDDPLGYRVLNRSGNLCVWFYFKDQRQNQGADGDRVRAAVQDIGGVCDGGMNFVLVFTIPLSVGFSAIDHLFDTLISQYDGATWMYGNVYDPMDGVTPLGWWQ